jgi:hypothetical protein
MLGDTFSILGSLARIDRTPILRRGGGPDCCILSTRVATGVLRDFGIEASPLTVHVTVGDASFARLMEDQVPPADTEAFRRLCEERGARSINLGDGQTAGKGWPHHLVAIVEGRFLFDWSIDQAKLHMTGTELEPVIISCDGDFLSGRCGLRHVTKPGGCYLNYRALPIETSYQTSRAWTDIEGLVECMTKRVREDTNG